MNKPVALIIMDGFGNSPSDEHNAIKQSGTPNIKRLMDTYAVAELKTSGLSVGLPDGTMGNSEVGHLNIGAGRVVYQDLTAIDKSIAEKEFFGNKAFNNAIDNCIKHGTALHLMGLLSDGCVHSSIEHLYALLELAKKRNLSKVYVHAIMDGRDVPPTSGITYITTLEAKLRSIGVGTIATVTGRYYLLDRDNRWERVRAGYDAVFGGIGDKLATAKDVIDGARSESLSDEFIRASVVGGYTGVNDNDSMIFFNFRADRAREISKAIIYKDFDSFERVGGHKSILFVGMTQYDASFAQYMQIAFEPKDIQNTLGEWLAHKGIRQTRVAETEKYAHVTFFFNGGVEAANALEDRILVASPKVATYDLKPDMSADEVMTKCIEALEGGTDVLVVNFANCDMVGHTGVMDAAIKAVNTVDRCVKQVVDCVLKLGGSALITADHGNAEVMAYADGSPMTSHTTLNVPVIVVGDKYKRAKLANGSLCDVAPTLLAMLGVDVPKEMTGKNLLA